MSDLQTIADRFEIEALRGEFTDAVTMRDFDRFVALFTDDAAWRIPYINAELVGQKEIRTEIERMQGLWDYFVQIADPGTVQLEGDAVVGRADISEVGHKRDGHLGVELLPVPRPLRANPHAGSSRSAGTRSDTSDTHQLAGAAPHAARA